MQRSKTCESRLEVEQRLQAAREAGLARRRKIQKPLLTCSCALHAVGWPLQLLALTGAVPRPLLGAGTAAIVVAEIFSLAALLPTDHCRIRLHSFVVAVIGFWWCGGEGAGVARYLRQVPGHQGSKWVPAAHAAYHAVMALVGLYIGCLLLGHQLRRSLPRRQLEVLLVRVPRSLLWAAAAVPVGAAVAVFELREQQRSLLPGIPSRAAFGGLLLAVGLVPRSWRERLQGWLANRGGGVAKAAGIAALLTDMCSERITELACTTCRAVSLDRVLEEDMRANAPDPRLRECTRPVALGEVDTFVSHSWHDDPGAKWRTLQRWRRGFKAAHGREPLVWIDKYCIDQTDIQGSLASLPVCLAGCQQLLVLAGLTYPVRMWCVVELFTFIQMGGSAERIEVFEVDPVDWNAFDVRAATASKPEDADRLRNVIEAGSGSVADFNASVRDLVGTCARWSASKDDIRLEVRAGVADSAPGGAVPPPPDAEDAEPQHLPVRDHI